MISRPLSVVPRFEVPARAHSVASSSANSVDEPRTLTIPNPFKAVSNKSTENIATRGSDGMTHQRPASPNTDFSRLRFGQEQDVGEAVFSSTPRRLGGLCSRYVVARDGVLGLAWTDTEVMVRSGAHAAIAPN